MVHYLGKDIQNELIQLLSGAIKQTFLARVNSAKYYSVILECTPDVNHIEQMTMIVHYVDVIKPSDTEMPEPEIMIKEHYLGFIPLKETTGAFRTETPIGQLEKMGLPLENLHGQGYDSGSNMNDKENGL
ncbi:Zinc finger MYM-type protein 1 [Varanus komodoensis]|nr:Zinc finger MYM-type protein 1 [Varanus komodoensis]